MLCLCMSEMERSVKAQSLRVVSKEKIKSWKTGTAMFIIWEYAREELEKENSLYFGWNLPIFTPILDP